MKQKKKIRFLKLFSIFLIWIMFFVVVSQVLLFFFSENILKPFIQKKVNQISHQLYQLDFDDIKVNLIKRNLYLTNIVLSPDTVVYNNLIDTSDFNKPVYEVRLDTFEIRTLSIFNLLKKKRILNVNEIILNKPYVKLITISKTAEKSERKNEYEVAKKDLIPFLLNFFYALKINKITIENGVFDLLVQQKTKDETFSANDITMILNDFDINRDNYETKQELLYTDNVELKIDGYKLNLKDKIHTLEASDIYISTKKKLISLNQAILSPSQMDTSNLADIEENYYSITIPKIELQNADFENLYINSIIDLKNIEINDAVIKFYKKKIGKDSIKTKIDFYKLIEGNLNFINVDTFALNNAEFMIFDNITDKTPRTQISNFTLQFFNFEINEQSAGNSKKILGSDNISLKVQNFNHRLKDNVHSLSAEVVEISSQNQTIYGSNINLMPENNNFSQVIYHNTNKVSIPVINLTGVDIHKFYNENILEIEDFTVENPILNFISVNTSENKTKKSNDNFQNNLSSLTEDYLELIKIQNLRINSGTFSIRKFSQKKNTFTSGNLTLHFNMFSFNPNQTVVKLFAAENIEILFTNYKLEVPESFHNLYIGKFEISTYKEGIFFENIKVEPVEDENIVELMKENNKSILLNLEIPDLQIHETNVHRSFLEDSLKISGIEIPEATVELTIIPFGEKKTDKIQNIIKLKNKAVLNINRAATESKLTFYLNVNQIDSTKLELIKERQKIIDSIQSFAVASINNMLINPKHISSEDSTYQPLTDIETIAGLAIKEIGSKKFPKSVADSIFRYSINKISYVNNTIDKNFIEKQEIYELVGSFLNVIDIDNISLLEGDFIFNKYINDEKQELFHNNFTINMYDFYFNYDSLETTNRFLFSRDIDVKLENYILNLKDNIHKLIIREIELSTEKSQITLNNISISPFSSDFFEQQTRIYAYTSKAILSNIDLIKLYEDQKIEIEKLYIKKPLINILKKDFKKTDTINRNKLAQVLLPTSIKSLIVKNLQIDTGKIKLVDTKGITEKTILQSDFNVEINNFLIDSVTFVSDNPLFIPIENLTFTFFKFKFNLNDNIHSVTADNITYSSLSSTVKAENLKISYDTTDSLIISKLVLSGKNSLMDILFPEIEISDVNIKDIKDNKILDLNEIIMTSPVFKIHNYAYLKKNIKDSSGIQNIDLYKIIKPFLNKFEAGNILFSEAELEYFIHNKTKNDTLKLNHISGKISELKIDSTSQKNNKNLFLADDITISISDFSKIISDSVYTFTCDEIGFSTKNSKIFLNNFEIVPNYDKSIISTQIFGYQKSVMNISGRHLDLYDVDLIKLLNSKSIISQKVIAEGLIMEFYKDMHPIFNDTLNPVHPMSYVRNLSNYLKIDTLLIVDSEINYEQLSENKTQTGVLTLKQINGYILNITNDSVLIKNNISLIADFYMLLMGTGKTHVNINLPLNSKDNYHEIEGSLEEMNLADINEFTTNAFSASISNGFIKKMNFKIKGNDSISNCVMRMYYNDLEVNVLMMDTTENVKKRNFLSFIINKAVIRQDNPKVGVLFQKGDIVFIHDNTHQFLYNWLQPIIKAITATVVGNETANMVEKQLAKAQIKKQRRKEEKKLQEQNKE